MPEDGCPVCNRQVQGAAWHRRAQEDRCRRHPAGREERGPEGARCHCQRREGQLVSSARRYFSEEMDRLGDFSNDKSDDLKKVWGGGLRGNKSTEKLRRRAKAAGQNITAASAQKL